MNKMNETNHVELSNLKNNRMPLAALILAVLGLSLGFLDHILKGGYGSFGGYSGIGGTGLVVDLVAFISGVTVFFNITFSKKKEKGRLLAIAAVFLSVLAVVLADPKNDGRDEEVGFYECRVRLHDLADSLDIYRIDYKDKNPSDLKVLTEYKDVTLRMLTCPDTKDFENRHKESRSWYVYRGNDLNNTCPDGLILAHDRLGTHQDGRNVLFFVAEPSWIKSDKTNDPVKWFIEEDFQKAIERDNVLRQQAGLPEKDIHGNVIN